jgi:hypothetical protein
VSGVAFIPPDEPGQQKESRMHLHTREVAHTFEVLNEHGQLVGRIEFDYGDHPHGRPWLATVHDLDGLVVDWYPSSTHALDGLAGWLRQVETGEQLSVE